VIDGGYATDQSKVWDSRLAANSKQMTLKSAGTKERAHELST
jgi:hypothetical protein